MNTHSPLLSHRTILMIAIFTITLTLIATVFIMSESKPYTILLISLLTAFCMIILVKIKIKNKSLSPHYYDSKTSKPDTADKFLFEQLYIRNCNPKKDNDAIIFHHKNGIFKAEWLDHKVIRIIFPHIFAAPPSHHDKLVRIANQLNIDYVLVKVVAVPRSDNSEIRSIVYGIESGMIKTLTMRVSVIANIAIIRIVRCDKSGEWFFIVFLFVKSLVRDDVICSI